RLLVVDRVGDRLLVVLDAAGEIGRERSAHDQARWSVREQQPRLQPLKRRRTRLPRPTSAPRPATPIAAPEPQVPHRKPRHLGGSTRRRPGPRGAISDEPQFPTAGGHVCRSPKQNVPVRQAKSNELPVLFASGQRRARKMLARAKAGGIIKRSPWNK